MLTLVLALALLQDVDDLVKKLGSEDYAEREKATEALRAKGKDAEEALRKAQASEDPEVRSRSKALLEELNKPAPGRRAPVRPPFQGPFGQGFRGSSVSVTTINGDSTYSITPGDGSPALTFRRAAAGAVALEVDGKTVEAPTLAAFLKEQAALAGKYGISEEGIEYAGARVSFKGGLPNPPGFRFNFGRKGPWPFEEPAAPEAKRADFEPTSDALREQLALPEGQGVVVARDGAAAGLKQHDVLLEIDGKAVGSVAAARKAAAGATSFTVLRKGKRETIAVAPKKDF